MKRIADLTEKLASGLINTDSEDLQGLAALHSGFQEMREMLKDLAEQEQAVPPKITDVATQAERLLEQIILRDTNDSQTTMKSIGNSIAELQNLVSAAMGGPMSAALPDERPPAPPAAPAPAAAPAAPAETQAQVDAKAAAKEAKAQAASPYPPITEETVLTNDDIQLAQDFMSESASHIENAEAGILRLEENPEDMEVINAIFRSFHTIKGVAGFLNLKQVGSLAHAGENLLDLARQGKMQMSAPVVDLILEAIDLTKALMAAIEKALQTATPIAIEPRLPDMLHRLHVAAENLGAVVPTSSKGETANASANTAEAAPAPDAAASDSMGMDEDEEEAAPVVAPVAAAQSSAPAAGAKPEGAKQGSTSEATVKVATDRLDSLINMVGELVIAQVMVQQDMVGSGTSSQRLQRNMGHLGKITRELQDLSMSMRMVPIQGVFQKMARLVRDLGRKAGKEIDFSVIGGETELDRNVVEAISDPLVHMVRNSADHGIEPPAERLAAGKPRAGKVQLRAYHQAGHIVIEISDDGRGLRKDKIIAKAIAAGIVQEGQELSDPEIFKLIFHAGLSTADKVTDISGRGVGMDVVKKNVEALRGRIDITSETGKGSTFTIRLPLTLAVIDGLVVKVGAERYIIPINSIEQSMQPRQEQLSTVQNRGEMLMIRGKLLPLFRLHRLFRVTPVTEDPTKALVVIVQSDSDRCCLLVDELLGQQQVVIKSLGEGMGNVRGISGGAILGDGNVSLILDVPGLIEMSAGR